MYWASRSESLCKSIPTERRRVPCRSTCGYNPRIHALTLYKCTEKHTYVNGRARLIEGTGEVVYVLGVKKEDGEPQTVLVAITQKNGKTYQVRERETRKGREESKEGVVGDTFQVHYWGTPGPSLPRIEHSDPGTTVT